MDFGNTTDIDIAKTGKNSYDDDDDRRPMNPYLALRGYGYFAASIAYTKRTKTARIETELRSVRLKNAIENYLIPLFDPYEVRSLRCLWCPDSDEAEKEIWARQRMLEDIIISKTDVVDVVSCSNYQRGNQELQEKKEEPPKPLSDPFSESSGTEEESDEFRSAQRCRPSRKSEV